MEGLFNYITSPDTIISFIAFVFWLWVIYTSITNKQKELEMRIEKIEDLDLDSRLTRMEANLDWIRITLEKLDKFHQ